MAYNKAKEEKKWRLWKEAEEKQLRSLGVNEDDIEKLRVHDWAIFNSDRRYYQRVQETGTYLDELAEDTTQPEVKTVEDFLDSIVPELASPLMAAMGKLQVEEADLKPEGIMKDWLSYIRIQCTEDEGMAKAVRRKGKSLKKCIGVLLKWSFENAREINKEVAGYAGIPKNVRVTLGIPDMGTAKRLIMEYYGS